MRIVGRKWMAMRAKVAARDIYTCQKCKRLVVDGQVDHITPLQEGGSNDLSNLQWMCRKCHSEKTAKENANRQGFRGKIDVPGR